MSAVVAEKSVSEIPEGTRERMPARMMRLTPFPMPNSVMSSPSHMRKTDPAAMIMTFAMSTGALIVPMTFCPWSRKRKATPCRIAMGMVRSRLHWMNFARPDSPSSK